MNELDEVLPLLTEQERGAIVEEAHRSNAHGGNVGLGWCHTHSRAQALCYQEEYLKAQRAADVRNLVAWLRAFSLRDSDHPTHIIHEGRGYGEWLKDATDELDAMLGAEKP